MVCTIIPFTENNRKTWYMTILIRHCWLFWFNFVCCGWKNKKVPWVIALSPQVCVSLKFRRRVRKSEQGTHVRVSGEIAYILNENNTTINFKVNLLWCFINQLNFYQIRRDLPQRTFFFELVNIHRVRIKSSKHIQKGKKVVENYAKFILPAKFRKNTQVNPIC